MGKTGDNLKEAFAGESQASTRYRAFARKADQEGYPGVAKLFRAASAAEVVHARNHLEVMDGVKSTAENLQEAISGENAEHVTMYPDFIGQAGKEEKPKAVRTFEWARKVEMIHESLYKAALGSELWQATGYPLWMTLRHPPPERFRRLFLIDAIGWLEGRGGRRARA